MSENYTTTQTGTPVASDAHSLTAGQRRRHRAARPVPRGEARPVQPRAHPGADRAREGRRRVRRVRRHRRRLARTRRPPSSSPARRTETLAAVLLGRRRAGLARHLARRARLLGEVLHDRGQLRHRRQQHPRLLHPRRHQVPRLHPLAEAPPGLRPPRRRHAVGLLDALARVGAPGHLPDGRPRPPALVAHHARLRLAHLPVDQRRRRALLGEVPLPRAAGQRGDGRRRGRSASPARTPTTTAATCTRRSSAATSRRGRCRCRSCRTRTPRPTASTRSTSPRCGRTATTR